MPFHFPKVRVPEIRRAVLPILLFAAHAWSVLAVPPATSVSFVASRVYPVGTAPSGIVVGDFNGDGRPDLATVNAGSNDVSVLLNSGSGAYLPAVNYAVGTGPVAISIGDFNGDGKLDIAVINRASSSISVLLGNGDGTFQPQKSTIVTTGNLPDSLAIGDFNGDGKLDVAVTVSLPQVGQRAVAVLLGNGDGTFQAATNYDSGSVGGSVVVADFNGDSKPDIAVSASNTNAISILLGRGDGTFQPPLNTVVPSSVPIGFISLGDFNHDGKTDILMASGALYVFLGNGDGSFEAPVATAFPSAVTAVAVGDLNGDGLPDAVGATESGLGTFLGLGDGTFQQVASFQVSLGSGVPVIADLDGDGKVDLATADGTAQQVLITFGNGDGSFQVAKNVFTPPPFVTSLPALFAVTADLNSDGKRDLIVAGGSRGNGYVGILLGNGDATFQTPITQNIAAGMRSAGPIAVGDLNRDGKPDLVVVQGDGGTGVLIGNGDGTFQPAVTYTPSVSSVAVGDFNGDGIPDIIGIAGNLALWIGNGDGTFGFPTTIPIANAANAFAVADFNHDGKLDLALGGGGQVSILLGNGDGTFKQSASYSLPLNAFDVAVGDFNHDGNLDVVLSLPDGLGNPAPPPSNTVAVLLGNGNGTLQPPLYYSTGVIPNSVAVADLINNGNLDVIVLDRVAGNVAVLLGNGDGSFQSAENFGASGQAWSIVVGDFNGRGAPDIAVATGPSGASLLVNRGSGSAPGAALAPSLVSFGSQPVGVTSGLHLVTLSNTGSAALSIGSIKVTGLQATDFSQTNTCGVSLAAGGNCSLSITFKPSATGIRVAAIEITDNAFSSPQMISLNGTGVPAAPSAGLNPSSVTFAGELIGTTTSAQIITLTNTGNAPLTISGITIIGANNGEFGQSNTCPASPATLAAQASCTISITFKPTATGNRTASASISDDAVDTPQSIPLIGTGTDFSLAVASGPNCPAGGNCSTMAVISAGQTATYNLQVSPIGGFNGNVALTCSGAPTPSTCAVSPVAVPPSGSATYAFSVTINGTSGVETLPLMNDRRGPPRPWPMYRFIPATPGLWMILMLGLTGFLMVQEGRRRLLLSALASLLMILLCGCGSNGTTVQPPVNATVTVTGNSAGVNRTLQLSLTVSH